MVSLLSYVLLPQIISNTCYWTKQTARMPFNESTHYLCVNAYAIVIVHKNKWSESILSYTWTQTCFGPSKQGQRHGFESGGDNNFFCMYPHFSQCGGYKKLKSQNISKPKHNTIGAQPWFQSWEVGPARGGCRSLLQRGPWRARKHASSYKGVWGLWPPVGSRGLPLVGGVRGASPPEGDGISAWLYYTRDLNLTLLTYTCMKNKVLVSFISCARHTRP